VVAAVGTGIWSRLNFAAVGTAQWPSTFPSKTAKLAGRSTPTPSSTRWVTAATLWSWGIRWAGFTAPLVCARTPVDLLVLVAAMIPSPGELFSDWWTNIGYQHSGHDDVFYHDVPPALAAEARRRERDEAAKALQQPWPLQSWPDTPTKYLLCRDDRMFPPQWARRHARDRLGIEPDQIDGGHYITLARPRQLADRLVAYAAEVQ
jgi:hypothetical protein